MTPRMLLTPLTRSEFMKLIGDFLSITSVDKYTWIVPWPDECLLSYGRLRFMTPLMSRFGAQ